MAGKQVFSEDELRSMGEKNMDGDHVDPVLVDVVNADDFVSFDMESLMKDSKIKELSPDDLRLPGLPDNHYVIPGHMWEQAEDTVWKYRRGLRYTGHSVDLLGGPQVSLYEVVETDAVLVAWVHEYGGGNRIEWVRFPAP